MLCRFSLQHKQQLLGLPAGMCIKVKVGQQEQAYNPISTDETPGEVVILVKVRACSTVCIPLYGIMPFGPSGMALSSHASAMAVWSVQHAAVLQGACVISARGNHVWVDA